jgi:hypothetical protein
MSIETNIKDKKTTYSGIFLIALAILYFVPAKLILAFTEVEIWETSKFYAGGMIGAGLLLILAPDSILGFADRWLKKKAE